MAFTARLRRDDRASDRQTVKLDGTLRDSESKPYDVTVTDLSADGFRIIADTELWVGCAISLGLSGIGACQAVVIHATGTEYGCQFLKPLSPTEIVAALSSASNAPIAMLHQRGDSPSQDQDEDEVHDGEHLPLRVRLIILALVAVLPWAMIVGARHIF